MKGWILFQHSSSRKSSTIYSHSSGAVHKVRHAIFGQFFPPLPLSHFVTHPGTPPKVRHTSRTLPIFSRPSTTKPDKSPLYKFSLNCSQGFLSRGSVRGSFVRKVLSRVVFVHSPFCQNTSVTTES